MLKRNFSRDSIGMNWSIIQCALDILYVLMWTQVWIWNMFVLNQKRVYPSEQSTLFSISDRVHKYNKHIWQEIIKNSVDIIYTAHQNKKIQNMSYACTERIFAIPQFVYNGMFVKKLF